MATKSQIKQRSVARSVRNYKALGHAYKFGPLVKALVDQGLSQRQVAAQLTSTGVPTASEWEPSKVGRPAKGQSVWTQTQVVRLLKSHAIVREKMKWYYVQAHKDQRQMDMDPAQWSVGQSDLEDKVYKLRRHTRKAPSVYYKDTMLEFRENELVKSGVLDPLQGSSPEEIQREWTRLVRRRSYYRVKARKAAEAKK